MSKKTLKTFRVRPAAYEKFLDHARDVDNRSAAIRSLLSQACAQPPGQYPVREIKADLTAFSVFLDVELHDELLRSARRAGVSKNLFIEAAMTCL